MELEAVDVSPSLQIETADDPQAIVRGPELVGVLPGDFPADLPIYLPASLVDFGTADDGWGYVSLLTPHALARVKRELSAKLAESGWAAAKSDSVWRLRKGNVQVRLRVTDARPGTEFRFEYP